MGAPFTLASLAQDCGMDGVVCSAQEASSLRRERGQDFCLVTPGIRLSGDTSSDQRRVVTPVDALGNGADYLVMGRSITGAQNPLETLEQLVREIGSIE